MNNHVRKNNYRASGLMVKGRVPLLSTRRNISDSYVFMLSQTASIALWVPQQDEEPHIMITGSSLHRCSFYSDPSISYVNDDAQGCSGPEATPIVVTLTQLYSQVLLPAILALPLLRFPWVPMG